jgi:HPt (histidine-containing phosphotransfer) domain-containing protein
MDDLHAKFLPQFIELARARVATAVKAVLERDDAATLKVIRELHSLAGDAGLLGLHDVVPLARDGEQKAKTLHVSHSEADAEALASALRQLDHVIERIGGANSAKRGDS